MFAVKQLTELTLPKEPGLGLPKNLSRQLQD